MASVPTGKAEVAHWAEAEASVTDEHPVMEAPFEVNATVPVGPVGEVPPLTVAVKVTDWPTVEGFTLEASAVVVAALFTTWESAELVLPLFLLSPE